MQCTTHNRRRRWILVAVAMLLSASAVVQAAMPSVFSDNMVLQRERPIPVWGKAGANATVSVSIGENHADAKADATGRWMVRLPAMPAGGPYTLSVKEGKNTATFKNVLIGEVWVCSGQSNMGFTVNRAVNAKDEIAAANFPKIHLLGVKLKTATSSQDDVETEGWKVCSPDTVGSFSAVAYFFGRELHRKLDVPVGLINTSWGGTAIEPWTPPLGFVLTPTVAQYFDQIQQADRDYARAIEDYATQREAWSKLAKQAVEKGGTVTPMPEWPVHALSDNNGRPSVIYNAMVHAMVPYGIAGAIWYQGENNCSRGDGLVYFEKMKALIAGWRAIWGEGDFPFYYVQLAPWEYGKKYNGAPDRLPLTWQAQLMALSIPNTGMAVTTDIGNVHDIHPTNKQEVGRRLALWALAKTYGQKDLVYSGPLYKSMSVEGDKIRIRFDHVGGGLAVRDGKPLSWFAIAGEDKRFAAAEASIDGDTLLVSSDKVAKPVAVRFGWNEEAEPNLMNAEGLPASPFRTDDWKEVPSTQPGEMKDKG